MDNVTQKIGTAKDKVLTSISKKFRLNTQIIAINEFKKKCRT